jgi:hypothetical protein
VYIYVVNSAFTMELQMNTFTLRHIPPQVERSLRRLAFESHQSLNKTAIGLLAKATGTLPEEKKSRKRRDVKSVLRRWSAKEHENFQKNTKLFEAIDKEIWRT